MKQAVADKGTITASMRHSFYLSFRPAALETVDTNTVPIGIPSWIKMATTDSAISTRYYFARLHSVSALSWMCWACPPDCGVWGVRKQRAASTDPPHPLTQPSHRCPTLPPAHV